MSDRDRTYFFFLDDESLRHIDDSNLTITLKSMTTHQYNTKTTYTRYTRYIIGNPKRYM